MIVAFYRVGTASAAFACPSIPTPAATNSGEANVSCATNRGGGPDKKDKFIFGDFQTFIHKTTEKLINPNEVVKFGCTFIFDTKNYDEIKRIKNTSLLIEDYTGKEYTLPMDMPIPEKPILYILNATTALPKS